MKIIHQYDELQLDPPRYRFIIQAEHSDIYDDIEIMDEWLLANIMKGYRRSPRAMARRVTVDIFDAQEAMVFKLVWA